MEITNRSFKQVKSQTGQVQFQVQILKVFSHFIASLFLQVTTSMDQTSARSCSEWRRAQRGRPTFWWIKSNPLLYRTSCWDETFRSKSKTVIVNLECMECMSGMSSHFHSLHLQGFVLPGLDYEFHLEHFNCLFLLLDNTGICIHNKGSFK